MRTHGHSPGIESAAQALGKSANNGAVWLVLGVALAIVATVLYARAGIAEARRARAA
jgi:hypothetical protein